MKYSQKDYGSKWKYAVFIIVQETKRFYCWANTNELIYLFTKKKLIYGYKFYAQLLTGENALEIENKKDYIIDINED